MFSKFEPRYRVVTDYVTHLEILDKKTGEFYLKNPMDILFSTEYKEYSQEDIIKIGFICGQISTNRSS
jgi:hypothetical protein